MPIPITARGAKMLKDELQRLKTQDRPAVVQAIAEAREKGDLSENAEYDAARESQAFIEGRILELESKIAQFQVIDPSTLPDNGKVVFSATVTIEDVETGNRQTVQIVGNDESDTKLGRISVASPMARGLNRQVGRGRGGSTGPGGPVGIRNYFGPIHLIDASIKAVTLRRCLYSCWLSGSPGFCLWLPLLLLGPSVSCLSSRF